MSKFKTGDIVRIVNYGHRYWETVDGEVYVRDMNPDLVGQVVVIEKVSITQEIPHYSVIGVSKSAWYNEDQLELIEYE